MYRSYFTIVNYVNLYIYQFCKTLNPAVPYICPVSFGPRCTKIRLVIALFSDPMTELTPLPRLSSCILEEGMTARGE